MKGFGFKKSKGAPKGFAHGAEKGSKSSKSGLIKPVNAPSSIKGK